MSYLRGPITRDEIEQLQEAAPAAASTAPPAQAAAGATPTPQPVPSPAPVAAAPPPTPVTPSPAAAAAPSASAPPPLPSPLRARFLNRFGGNVARPHLFVKAAVRYKTRGGPSEETMHTLAFALDPSLSPAEIFSSQGFEADEGLISDLAPAGVSYQEPPAYLSMNGPRVLERAMSDRLDDYFAVDLLYDPQTKLLSHPGEAPEAFAFRVQNAPAIQTKRRQIETRLASKRASVDAKQDEVKARGMEKWASLGTSILSNIGILTGRKRTVTGVGGVLSKQRMESTTRNRIEILQDEIAQLETDLEALTTIDPMRFESRAVKPARTDISVIRYDILWVT
jgi:hypothetical protein